MPNSFGIQSKAAFVAAAMLFGLCADASAQTGYSGFLLSCDNGRDYPIQPRAVSDAGELVTGFLYLGPRRAVHIRLVPMGVGYRYIARGLWFDGWRGTAVLHFGTRVSTGCRVLPAATAAVAVRALGYAPQ